MLINQMWIAELRNDYVADNPYNPYSKFKYDNNILKTKVDTLGNTQNVFGGETRGLGAEIAAEASLNEEGDGISPMMRLTGTVVTNHIYESVQVTPVDTSLIAGIKQRFFKLFKMFD